jgi:flagellar assembly protein FliH
LARKIFKAAEVKEIGSKVLITPPQIQRQAEEVEDVAQEVEEVTEPQDDFDAAPAEQIDPEEEREKILHEATTARQEAESEAKRIRSEAEEAAFKIMQSNSIEARKQKEEAEAEAEEIRGKARAEAAQIVREAQLQTDQTLQETRSKAYQEGREEGFNTGKEEVERLIDRLHIILNAAIDKRKSIVENTERQLLDLILIIARKVVKVISESEKEVVVENIHEALKKVKGEKEIIIRVNLKDLNLVTKHKKRFITLVEGLAGVTIEEDSRVDPGGCIIETSLGDIDARIATQLSVIEEKIRELMPVKG